MPDRSRSLRIDVHVHLAGVGTQSSGCWVSPSFRRRFTFVGMRLAYGLTPEQMRVSVDQDWAAMIAERVERSDLDHAVVLGFDGVYGGDGLLDRHRSQMIVPPSWVFDVCTRYRRLLPGPSINPFRRDAMERLEEAIERGAVLIKWLPIVQVIDTAAPRVRPFYRRLAEAGIPLLVHAGTGEVTFGTEAPEFLPIRILEPALNEGVTVICAHAAARLHLSFEPDQRRELGLLLERFPNLWVDNSGLANLGRFRHLPRLAKDPLVRDRTLHGSDFPVPSNSLYYLPKLGLRRVREIEGERNGLQRDLLIKRAVGFPEESFTRASGILANLERWTGGSSEMRGR